MLISQWVPRNDISVRKTFAWALPRDMLDYTMKTHCYARYTRLRSCFPKGRGRHRCEGVRRKNGGSAEDVIWKILYVVYFK